MQHIAGLASLLRVWAGPGDALWLPLPVDPRRLPALPGSPLPELASGPLPQHARALLCWAQTPASARIQVRGPHKAEAPPGLWDLVCAPAAARRANDRRHWLAWAVAEGLALPGAQVCRERATLFPLLQGDWVLKAPFSAAGRARLRGQGPPSPSMSARIERMLLLHGSVVYEPWLQRDGDSAYLGVVRDAGVQLLGGHILLVDRAGGFRGIELRAPTAEERLARVARKVGVKLQAEGYRGAFGIDAFTHAGGLHPLVEVNARVTFGHLARAYASLFGQATLRLVAADAAALSAASPQAVLLLPAEGGKQACWLEW